MRSIRLVLIFVLTIFMLIGISPGSTRALEPEDWAGTWFKIKVTLKAVCDDLTDLNQKLFNGSGKEAAWIYIDSEYDGGDEIVSFLIIKDNGVWQAIDVQLTRVLGYANDVVLESDTVDVDEDIVNIIEVFYCVRMKAKEKKGVLKSAKLTSVAGTLYVYENNDNEPDNIE